MFFNFMVIALIHICENFMLSKQTFFSCSSLKNVKLDFYLTCRYGMKKSLEFKIGNPKYGTTKNQDSKKMESPKPRPRIPSP